MAAICQSPMVPCRTGMRRTERRSRSWRRCRHGRRLTRARMCSRRRSAKRRWPVSSVRWVSTESVRPLGGDEKPREPLEAWERAIFKWFVREMQGGEAPDERSDRHLRLDASEWRTEAEVCAAPERMVMRVLAADVEAVRVRVDGRIVVRGVKQR